jgi:hypothetical protein
MAEMNLFDLSQKYVSDFEKLDKLDVDDATFRDTLEAISGDIFEKLDSVATYSKQLTYMADAIEKEIALLTIRRDKLLNKISSYCEYVKYCMTVAGIKKHESPRNLIRIVNNQQSVHITVSYTHLTLPTKP